MICLGMAPAAKKAALNSGVSPVELSIGVTAVAAAAVGTFFGRKNLGRFGKYKLRNYTQVFLVGLMGSGAVVILSILAMTETSATNRSLFQAMYPVATAICARLLLGEQLKGSAYAIIALMSLGLFLMNSGSDGLELGRPFWLMAGTLPLIGLADVIASRSLRDVEPSFVAVGRMTFGLVALAFLLPLTTWQEWLVLVSHWPIVLASGMAMAGGVLGLYRAMNIEGASLAAAFIALAPVVTAGTEWLLLNTSFSSLQLLGIGVTVSGAAVLALRY
ncbi:MAG TPA: DMT family transporter [Xanthomonadales bacterium]|nr:DMT family transporter [Xanthomonadales bacterium]